ncbi:hypothetical protein [Streptomyces sp. H036]|uniref:hypothetical protein n=1 Tax=Streptomyces sp. H036 TaxID=1519487 RepID=UPI0006AE8BD9|nr:hypothetical protein [Streptomyces sp. H036]KOV41933.1 hypothetical protein ADK98_25455 [Streptomyces sp. H036]
MSPKHSTHPTNRRQIAKALDAQTRMGYQRALQRVVDAAERGLLPKVLDEAGRAEAVRLLAGPGALEPDPGPFLAKDYLKALVAEFRRLGWGAGDETELDYFGLTTYAGPVAGLSLSVGRADDRDDDGEERDPDDPEQSDLGKPLYLMAMCPSGNATVDDFEDGLVDCSTESVRATARRLDTELGRTRLARVRGMEERSTTPCPICGDRYPAHHLLGNSPGAEPVCPACVFDGDQPYRTDLPYLAVRLDRLLHEDLSAPAGWDAVAAVLSLTCGANLRSRLDRALRERGGWPFVMERWGEPLTRSWIWLPPAADRHPMFQHLGAGANLTALVDAVDRHDPTARTAAKTMCREAEVRWRDALWPAAIAYAVALTTQGCERDRHRTPYHLVHSLSDGLGQIMKPFAVTGDAFNVEGGLAELLRYQLLPMLLGHSLDEEPDDPRRRYGAEDDDDRPAATGAEAGISHSIDRANQVAVILGTLPFTPPGVPAWDGAPVAGADAEGLGSTAPAGEQCAALRAEARRQAAETLYDAGGPLVVDADHAWIRDGWWIPSDHSRHAVRQARQFLSSRTRVLALWYGPGAQFPEPVQVCVEVTDVHARSTGPVDVPWLSVWDGHSHFGMTLSDLALVRRAEPGEELTQVWPTRGDADTGHQGATAVPVVPAGEPDAAGGKLPTAEELSLLTDRFLHLAGHRLGEGWKGVDEKAYAAHQRLEKALEAEYTGFAATSVKVWINLFDTAHSCLSGPGQPLPAYALTGKPYAVEFDVHAHDPSCGCGQEYGFGEVSDRVCQLLIVLCLYGGLIEVHPMVETTGTPEEGRAALRDITWEVEGPDGYDFREVQRRVIRDVTDADSPLNTDTNPAYIPPYMAADGWYLPEGGTSMMFHGRQHGDEDERKERGADGPA